MSTPKRPGFFQEKDGPGLTFVLVAVVVVAVLGAKYFGFAPGKKAVAPKAQQEQVQTVERSAPLVLIYTAHPTENYSPGTEHAKGAGDVVRVASALRDALQTEGVRAQLVEVPAETPWSQAFAAAREVLQPVIGNAQSVAAVIDIHRDAIANRADGYTTVMINGKPVAKVLFVVGDVSNPYIEQNLRFAEAVRARMETLAPGIMRGVKTLHEETNGDMHPRSLQVHIGEYNDNTVQEAIAAVGYVARAVAQVLQAGEE